ncbi:hypothetical protein NDU88_008065 [Pleurodeles waltl]|uniref:Uncharacterized protein n=1 Tax=Pleurodeles waltl TaxID=8319 RepID=A0AAV7RV02_PLEWA|nr:hypothetical protein NDU88_008065 [Pleurodeles waltl]
MHDQATPQGRSPADRARPAHRSRHEPAGSTEQIPVPQGLPHASPAVGCLARLRLAQARPSGSLATRRRHYLPPCGHCVSGVLCLMECELDGLCMYGF